MKLYINERIRWKNMIGNFIYDVDYGPALFIVVCYNLTRN